MLKHAPRSNFYKTIRPDIDLVEAVKFGARAGSSEDAHPHYWSESSNRYRHTTSTYTLNMMETVEHKGNSCQDEIVYSKQVRTSTPFYASACFSGKKGVSRCNQLSFDHVEFFSTMWNV